MQSLTQEERLIMTRQPLEFSAHSRTYLDLLESLSEAEGAYPWNPADPDSESYWQQLEDRCDLEPLTAEVAGDGARVWMAKLERIWSPTPAVNETLEKLQALLRQKFGQSVPTVWLDAIASVAGGQDLDDRPLVDCSIACVARVMPQWALEDLQVLARPFAFAMRSEAEPNEGINSREWSELSEIEKARASMAIAVYAIEQLRQESL
jgi:hypothetical protein